MIKGFSFVAIVFSALVVCACGDSGIPTAPSLTSASSASASNAVGGTLHTTAENAPGPASALSCPTGAPQFSKDKTYPEGQLTLRFGWKEVPNAFRYASELRLYKYGVDPDRMPLVEPDLTTIPEYISNPLQPETTYLFRVKVVTVCGTEGAWATVIMTTGGSGFSVSSGGSSSGNSGGNSGNNGGDNNGGGDNFPPVNPGDGDGGDDSGSCHANAHANDHACDKKPDPRPDHGQDDQPGRGHDPNR